MLDNREHPGADPDGSGDEGLRHETEQPHQCRSRVTECVGAVLGRPSLLNFGGELDSVVPEFQDQALRTLSTFGQTHAAHGTHTHTLSLPRSNLLL
jgi:hypothetical protein